MGNTQTIRVNETSSYWEFELANYFLRTYQEIFKGNAKTVRVSESSSDRGLELLGFYSILSSHHPLDFVHDNSLFPFKSFNIELTEKDCVSHFWDYSIASS